MTYPFAFRLLAPALVSLVTACSGPVTAEGTNLQSVDLLKGASPALLARLSPVKPEPGQVTIPFGEGNDGELKVAFTCVTDPETHVAYFKDLGLQLARNARYEVTASTIGTQMDVPRTEGAAEQNRTSNQAITVLTQFAWKTGLGTSHARTFSARVYVDGTVKPTA